MAVPTQPWLSRFSFATLAPCLPSVVRVAFGRWKIVSFSRAACWYPALVDPVQHAIVREPLVPADGWLDVPTGPGLGIDIDEAALERLAVEHFSVA